MANNSKDVIYIDIDDEITSVIDKVQSSDAKILALVLPKRAAVFQSIVNMKLLKRAADEAKKRLVLITTGAGLLPLAGAVGLHVAKTLQSKPEVPAGPDIAGVDDELPAEELDEPTEVTAENAGDRPIGELAGAGAAAPLATDDAMETVELPDEEAADDAASSTSSSAPLPLAAKKDKKLAIPNFERFRLWLALAGLLLIAFIVFLYFAVAVLPKATITIKTDSSNINTSATLILDTTATTFDPAANVVPAKQVKEDKTSTQQVATTGQVNKGDKAKGTIDMTAQACAPNLGTPDSVPAGTGVSSNGLTFITQETASFSFDHFSSGSCAQYKANDIDITAQSGGVKYNLDNATFSVAGRSDINATGSTSDGTDNIVKVVAQADIDSAKQKLTTQDSGVKADLQKQLQQAGYYAVVPSYAAGTPTVTSDVQVGDTADNVTVTGTVTYTMYGAHKSDLQKVVDTQITDQIDPTKQSILSDGLENPDIKVTATGDTTVTISLQTVGVIGPELNTNEIKKTAAGKKSGQIKDALTSEPGVTDVTVKMSPFWVTTAPKKTSKITVTIAKPTKTVNTNANP